MNICCFWYQKQGAIMIIRVIITSSFSTSRYNCSPIDFFLFLCMCVCARAAYIRTKSSLMLASMTAVLVFCPCCLQYRAIWKFCSLSIWNYRLQLAVVRRLLASDSEIGAFGRETIALDCVRASSPGQTSARCTASWRNLGARRSQ